MLGLMISLIIPPAV